MNRRSGLLDFEARERRRGRRHRLARPAVRTGTMSTTSDPNRRDSRRHYAPPGIDGELFRRGDSAAVAATVALVRRAVAFRGFYVPLSERDDVVQEVVTQLWHALSAPGSGRPENFEAFVRAIAYRRCVDWVRRHRVTEPFRAAMTAASVPAPDAELLETERIAIGARILAALRSRCRELLELHAGAGLTYRQIAERQGRLEKTVRNQVSDCLHAARRLLLRHEARQVRRRAAEEGR